MVFDYGYAVEEHVIETSDGYYLRMFRIPGSLKEHP